MYFYDQCDQNCGACDQSMINMYFIQEDLITIMNTDSSDPAARGFLAGEGFGSSHSRLEPHPTDTVSVL